MGELVLEVKRLIEIGKVGEEAEVVKPNGYQKAQLMVKLSNQMLRE